MGSVDRLYYRHAQAIHIRGERYQHEYYNLYLDKDSIQCETKSEITQLFKSNCKRFSVFDNEFI